MGGSSALFAQLPVDNTPDTVRFYALDEVVVVSSTKETNSLKGLPAAVSLITPSQMEGMKIISVKDLSATIPNFFIPDYGSRMTVPVYVRGVGERSTGQTIGLYVDNMPYLDKSAFDFDFAGIQRIEVLRGPQGTLFGRNAMGGIIHIFTHSPLDYEQTQASLTGGNNGLFRANLSVSKKIRPHAGLSISGYYDRNDGYFTNQYTGKKEDAIQSAGGRARLDRQITDHWKAQFMANYDYTKQGAFPYGSYSDGKVGAPDYNDPGHYERKVAGGNFNLLYADDRILFNATTAGQYLDDDMHMDLDYTPQSRFTIHQEQLLRTYTEEVTIKSNTRNNYQWSFGAYGFINDLTTKALTTMGHDGIREIMQPVFDQIHESNPRAPIMTVKDDAIPIPGRFHTPGRGVALFHQSTCNNLLAIDGLSATAGIRLDYEKVKLDYDTQVGMNLDVQMSNRPAVPMYVDTTLLGVEWISFTKILPKVAVKYEWTERDYVYFSAANGYKAGGYNIQMFADLVQQALQANYAPNATPLNVRDAVSYRPEYSWNYELGYKGEWIRNRLQGEIAVFYVDVRDILLTQFVNSGQGRMLSNEGRVASMGAEASLSARLSDAFGMTANYGYTHATFADNDDNAEYAGKYVPYAPQHTLSAGVTYRKSFRDRWIDRIGLHAQYHAAGRIYWTAENDLYQKFYGLLNLKAEATKGIWGLSVWTKNTLNTDYAAFYFESMGQSLAQKGRPFQAGIDLSVRF
jgi:outer membrane receptor protein involved in Fe transport